MNITRKGQVIEFESAFDDIDEVKSFLIGLNSTNQFILSLLSAVNPSDSQMSWMHYLATEEVNKLFKEPEIGPYKELVEKMYKGVKSPNRKFNLNLPFNVSVCTIPNGINQGGLYIFENKNYVGKITKDGIAQFNQSNEDILNLLEDANENLLELAKVYGHETGCCSVCNRELSDAISIALGIGPICLKRFSS
jgi:hypothetical protein